MSRRIASNIFATTMLGHVWSVLAALDTQGVWSSACSLYCALLPPPSFHHWPTPLGLASADKGREFMQSRIPYALASYSLGLFQLFGMHTNSFCGLLRVPLPSLGSGDLPLPL